MSVPLPINRDIAIHHAACLVLYVHRWDSAIIPVKKGVFQLKVELAFHNGLRGFYFDNAFLLGNPIIQRVDHVVNFTWGLGRSALAHLMSFLSLLDVSRYTVSVSRISQYGTDYVSVRWLGKLLSPLDGQYTFLINADDNVRLWVNEELLVDKWWSFAGQTYGNITLTAGWFNDIRIEYR